MKGFVGGVLATGVITAIVILLMLEGKEEVAIQQERHIVNQRLNDAEFDRDFATAWNDEQDNAEYLDSKKAEIEALKERQKAFDEEFDQAFSRVKSDAQALRAELEKQSNEKSN